MSTTSFNVNQQLTSARVASPTNLVGLYSNGVLNNGVGALLISTSLGQLIIDGVILEVGDRVLLPYQTNNAENGIYVVNKTGSSLSLWELERSSDFQSIEQIQAGQFLSINAGQQLGGNLFVLSEPLPAYIGDPNVSFDFINVGNSGEQGPYLTVAANLSDVSDKQEAFTNIGLGSGESITIFTSSFPGGIYTLENPCPKYVFIVVTDDDGGILRLPPAQGDGAFSLSQGPTVNIVKFTPNIGTVVIQKSDGTVFYDPPNDVYGLNIFLTDNSTATGSWDAINFVASINMLDREGNDLIYTGSFDLSSDLIPSNSNFTPENYTPIGTDEYSNTSVTGNLAGIDIALGNLIPQEVTLQEAYDNGVDGNINLSSNRPLSISTITSAAAVNAVTTPSTGPNTISNYRMGGSVFTVSSERNVTALQYLDATFTQPGTRDVGIWIKSTQELLGSATIAKTDPLDGSGLYRTKVLNNPILLSTGIEYVVAATIYANETNYINPDAVPGTGISLIQSASGPASGSPIPLTFPTNYVTESNATPGGFFQFSTFTTNDSVTFNDDTTDSKTLAEVKSTSRATIFEPPMTTAQMNAMGTTNFGSSVFLNDVTPRRPYRYTGSAWKGLAYTDEIPSVPTLTQGQLIMGVTGNSAVAGSLTSPSGNVTFDTATNGQIKLNLLRPMPALLQGQVPMGVAAGGNAVFAGNFVSLDSSISIDVSTDQQINLTSAIGLQQAYNNGSVINIGLAGGTIPVRFEQADGVTAVEFYGDGFSPLMLVNGITNSTIPYAMMTDAQFSALGTLTTGMIGYGTTSNRLLLFDGMSVHQIAYTTDASNSGTFTPGISNVTNTSSISFIKGMYNAVGTTSGKIVTCSLQFSCSVTTPAIVSTVQISSLPISPGNFSNTTQAMSMGGIFYNNVTPGIGDGQVLDVVSNTGTTTLNFSFIPATNTGTKIVTISLMYVIQ